MASTVLALPKVIEILGPDGEYEKRRIALRGQYAQVVTTALAVKVIETPEQEQEVAGYGRMLQAGVKDTEAYFTVVKRQIDAIKAPILEAEKQDVGQYKSAMTHVSNVQIAWRQKLRKEQQEQERQAREAAEKQAIEDQLQRAIDAVNAGEDEETADAILAEPVVPEPIVILNPAPSTPSGSYEKFDYKAEVVNLMELVNAVAAGTVKLGAIKANESWLNAEARREKDDFFIPGCKLDKTEKMNYRS